MNTIGEQLARAALIAKQRERAARELYHALAPILDMPARKVYPVNEGWVQIEVQKGAVGEARDFIIHNLPDCVVSPPALLWGPIMITVVEEK